MVYFLIYNQYMQKYYEKKNLRLILGNCLEVLEEMPENTFDMIFADPPYKLSNGGFTCHAGKAVSVNKGKWDESKGIDEDFQFHLDWIKACRRVLKPNGTIWVSGTYHSIYSCGFALQGFKLRTFEVDGLTTGSNYKLGSGVELRLDDPFLKHETISVYNPKEKGWIIPKMSSKTKLNDYLKMCTDTDGNLTFRLWGYDNHTTTIREENPLRTYKSQPY